MHRNLSRLGLTALTLVAGQILVAQTVTTGAINGRVTDKTGNPVAAATVRLTSGQVSRTVVTAADGHFQAGLLNAGSWTVQVTKAGYSATRQTLTVTINTATTANLKLDKEGSATVEVVASNAAIDTTSTTTGANFSLDTLSAVPTGREMASLAYMTPGVTTSGFGASNGNAGLGLEISIGGASGAENSFSVDGLKTNDMRYGGQSVTMVQDFVDQVDIQTGGYKPEYSAMGGVFNVLTKSGSNDFAGSAWASHIPGTLSPKAKGTPWFRELPAASVTDVGARVGGAFVKDKFFYSFGVNYTLTKVPTYPNLSDLEVGSTKTPDLQFMGKLQYYATTDNQLTLTYFGNRSTATLDRGAGSPSNIYDGRGNADTSGDTVHNTSNFNLIWDSTLSPNLTMSLKMGQAKAENNITPNSNISLIRDRTYYAAGGPGEGLADELTYWATGGAGNNAKETNTTTQFTGDLTWVIGADHSLKVGYSYLKSNYADVTHRNGGQTWQLQNSAGFLRAVRNVYDNDSEANAYFQAIYLQDTWQVNKKLNLFYGIRMEDQKQVGANGSTFMHFKFTDYIQPRIGFTYDATGDGKSKISGSFAQYYMQIPQRMAIRTYGKEYYHLLYYGGADTPNSTATFNRATNTVTVTGAPYTDIDYSTGWSNDPLADGLKLPKRTEVLLGYEFQATAASTVGFHARYRKLVDPIEDSEITDSDGVPRDPSDPGDGGGQAIIWNPRGSVTWTSPFSHQKITVNDTLYPEAYNEYKALDVTYTYKTSDTYLFLGYTWSRDYGNYEGLISATNGQPDGGITASFDYYPYVGTGYLPTDHTHQFKSYGYKKIKVGKGDLSLGFNFLAQSGRPYSLQDDGRTSTPPMPDPGGYANANFQDLKMGNKGRLPWLTRLDLTFHYDMPMEGKMHLEPFFEIYNVLNHRPETAVLEQFTDRYGNEQVPGRYASPTDYQPSRSFRFGCKLKF